MASFNLPGTSALPSIFLNTISTAFGSGLIGLCLTAFLCGIAVLQAYHCLNEYTEDKVWLKGIIWLVTLLNLFHTAVVCAACYHYIITVLVEANLLADFKVEWSIPATVALHLIIAAVVLLYFTQTCYRILEDRKVQKFALVILAAPVLVYLGLGISVVVRVSQIKTLLQASQLQNAPTIPIVAMQVAADVLVSIALCIALPKPVYKKTRGVIRRIIIYTVSRGIITSMVALVELLAIVLAPRSLWFAAAEFIIPGLYANSLFSALNTRNSLRKRLEGGKGTDLNTQSPPAISILDFHRSVPTQDESSTSLNVEHPTKEEVQAKV